jgi:hypothetical protein
MQACRGIAHSLLPLATTPGQEVTTTVVGGAGATVDTVSSSDVGVMIVAVNVVVSVDSRIEAMLARRIGVSG